MASSSDGMGSSVDSDARRASKDLTCGPSSGAGTDFGSMGFSDATPLTSSVAVEDAQLTRRGFLPLVLGEEKEDLRGRAVLAGGLWIALCASERDGGGGSAKPTTGTVVEARGRVVLVRLTMRSGGGENFSCSRRSRSLRFSSLRALRRAIRATSRARMRYISSSVSKP